MNQVKNIYLATLLVSFSTVIMADENATKESSVTTPITEQVKSTELSMEEQIKKALGEVEQIKVLPSAEPKIVSESEARTLHSIKVEDSKKVVTKKVVKKVVKKRAKKRVKKRVKRVENINMDDIPMAKTYSMDYDVSQIKE